MLVVHFFRIIEPWIAQLQAERTRSVSINPRVNRVGRLAVGEPLGELPDGDERQSTWRFGQSAPF